MNVKVKLVELSFWSVLLNVRMFYSPKIPEILYTVPCKNNKCHSDHYHRHIQTSWYTPLKINMEHNHGGLEDHFPFQMGDL